MDRRVRNLDVTKTSMDKIAINNLVVSMRNLVKKCKSRVINKLVRQIKNYRRRKGEEQKQEKFQRKADRLVDQIMIIKKLDKDKTAQFCLSCTQSVKEAEKRADDIRAMTRVANDSVMQEFVNKWRKEHSDWAELAAYLNERITRRLKKKAKKLQDDTTQPVKTVIKNDPKVSLSAKSKKDSSLETNESSIKTGSPQKVKEVLPTDEDSNDSIVDSDSGDSDNKLSVLNKSASIDKSRSSPSKSGKVSDSAPKTNRKLNEKLPRKQKIQNESTKSGSDCSQKSDVVPSRTNSLLVVQEFDLNELEASDETNLFSGNIPDKPINVSTDVTNTNKGTSVDPFFLQSDEEVVDSVLQDETDDVTVGSSDEIDDGANFSTARGHMDTMFVGTLSSTHRKQEFKRKRENTHMKNGQNSSQPRQQQKRQEHGSRQDRKKNPTVRNNPMKNMSGDQEASKRISKEKLHPSWEASKKRKSEASIQTFSGKKVTFDD